MSIGTSIYAAHADHTHNYTGSTSSNFTSLQSNGITGSYITGSNGVFISLQSVGITGSNITGSSNQFTSVVVTGITGSSFTGSASGDFTSGRFTSLLSTGITGSTQIYTPLLYATTITGSTITGSNSIYTSFLQAGVVTGSTITGSTSIYSPIVRGTIITGSTVTGSISMYSPSIIGDVIYGGVITGSTLTGSSGKITSLTVTGLTGSIINTAGAVRFGDAGTPAVYSSFGAPNSSHSFTGPNELEINGQLEVDGNAFLDGNLTVGGATIPSGNKTIDLGGVSNYWNNIYYKTVNVGTSRLVESKAKCPIHAVSCVRTSSGDILLGDKEDYIRAWCPVCYTVVMEPIKHIDIKDENIPLPKSVKLNKLEYKESGNSHYLDAHFIYEVETIVSGSITGSMVQEATTLSTVELDEFETGSLFDRKKMIKKLALEEWRSHYRRNMLMEQVKVKNLGIKSLQNLNVDLV